MKMPWHTLSVKFFPLLLRAFSERAFVSLDFRRKYLKAFPFMKKISNKTRPESETFEREDGVMLLCLFLFVCLTSLCFVLGQAVMGLFK